MTLKVAIRVDASVQNGTGHVMRALTLARELRKRGAQVSFISRELPANLCDFIETQSFLLQRLSKPEGMTSVKSTLAHSHWLGVDWSLDAEQTASFLRTENRKPHWLVVDHYALDKKWESALRDFTEKVMVIDDLADRYHDCDLLLDQNLCGQLEYRYQKLISPECETLLGPRYALLREEFKVARRQLRNRDGTIQRVFIFFGGIDPSHETEKALKALALLKREDIEVDLVVGAANPNREKIANLYSDHPRYHFHSQVTHMAELMRDADLALGAAGTTTWERLCLGLPSVVVSIAENQEEPALSVAKEGAHIYLGRASQVTSAHLAEQIQSLLADKETVKELSLRSIQLVDGLGAERVVERMQTLL